MREEHSRPNQCMRIIEYMRANGKISSREAFYDLGIISFTKRISELRRMGYKITDEWDNVQNRYGEWCRIKRYKLNEEQENEVI